MITPNATYFGKTLHDTNARTAIINQVGEKCRTLDYVEPKHKIIGMDEVVREYGHVFQMDTTKKDGYNAALNGIANGLPNNEFVRDTLAGIYASHLRHGVDFDQKLDIPTAWEDLQVVARTLSGNRNFC